MHDHVAVLVRFPEDEPFVAPRDDGNAPQADGVEPASAILGGSWIRFEAVEGGVDPAGQVFGGRVPLERVEGVIGFRGEEHLGHRLFGASGSRAVATPKPARVRAVRLDRRHELGMLEQAGFGLGEHSRGLPDQRPVGLLVDEIAVVRGDPGEVHPTAVLERNEDRLGCRHAPQTTPKPISPQRAPPHDVGVLLEAVLHDDAVRQGSADGIVDCRQMAT